VAWGDVRLEIDVFELAAVGMVVTDREGQLPPG
jgi:hypothetical protein